MQSTKKFSEIIDSHVDKYVSDKTQGSSIMLGSPWAHSETEGGMYLEKYCRCSKLGDLRL